MVTKNIGDRHGACAGASARDDGSRDIDTLRIFDSCRQQDCLEDLLILLTDEGQRMVDNAKTVRIKSVRIPWVRIDPEETPFHRGYYRVNVRYYFHCVLECSNGIGTGQETAGLTVFDRSLMLYGGNSHVSSFAADAASGGALCRAERSPRIVLDAAEPVALRLTTVDFDRSRNFGNVFCDANGVPEEIAREFNGRFTEATPGGKVLFVSLGLFSMVRIERPTQLIVPACDSSVPTGCGDYHFDDADPCTLFRSMEFPLTEFYPDTQPVKAQDPVLPLESVEADRQKE